MDVLYAGLFPESTHNCHMDKTLLKGLKVLALLAQAPKPLGVTEVAETMGLVKSNAHRVLQTLVAAGYATPVAGSGKYRATLKLWSLGAQMAIYADLRLLAAPVLSRLRDATGETAFLAMLDHEHVIYVEVQSSAKALRVHTTVGARMPAHGTAAGKLLLAFDEDAARAFLADKHQRYTQHTLEDQVVLESELKKIRQQRWAVNRGEFREEISGIAVPVVDADQKVIASAGISGPTERFRPAAIKEWLSEVQSAGQELSRIMGAPV